MSGVDVVASTTRHVALTHQSVLRQWVGETTRMPMSDVAPRKVAATPATLVPSDGLVKAFDANRQVALLHRRVAHFRRQSVARQRVAVVATLAPSVGPVKAPSTKRHVARPLRPSVAHLRRRSAARQQAIVYQTALVQRVAPRAPSASRPIIHLRHRDISRPAAPPMVMPPLQAFPSSLAPPVWLLALPQAPPAAAKLQALWRRRHQPALRFESKRSGQRSGIFRRRQRRGQTGGLEGGAAS
mmetsp:Transcript_17460/g.47762  ORF Transcript_17460/g.47762 Transcript_17460/m.47762 type:complete len:242 (-) Transcript_17460:953-1678(-)